MPPLSEARKKANDKWKTANPKEYRDCLGKSQKKYYDANRESILERKRLRYQELKLLKESTLKESIKEMVDFALSLETPEDPAEPPLALPDGALV